MWEQTSLFLDLPLSFSLTHTGLIGRDQDLWNVG